jgi:PAS domain S-box-containing protein
MRIELASLKKLGYSYYAVLENIVDGLVVTDLQGTLLYANRAAERILALSRDKIVKRYYFDKEWNNVDAAGRPIPPEELPLSRALGEERVHNYEHALQDPATGKEKWLSVNAVPAHTEDGTLVGAVATFRDITDRKHTEKQLADERKFSSAVVEASGMLVVALDTSGNITRFNRACAELTGYSEEEAVGRCVWELLVPEDRRDEEKILFERIPQGDLPFKHQGEWVTKSGQRRFVAWSTTATTDGAGGVLAVIKTGIDITERKREEERRIESLRGEIASLQGQMTSTTGITADSYLQMPLSRDNPERFVRFSEDFAELLDLRLEELAYKQDNRVSERAKELAGRLGRVHAGPRDIIELYKKSLEGKKSSTGPKKTKVLLEEGRMLTLEVMGHLVSFYRYYYTGPSFSTAETAGKEHPHE